MSRETAYQVLLRIERDGAYSHIALDTELKRRELSAADQGLATELVYGCLTWRRAMDSILDPIVRKGVQSLDREVLILLRLGVYQMVFLDRIPDHAAVHETVELAGRHMHEATGLVNAVLRNVGKLDDPVWWRTSDRQKKPSRYLGQRYSLPNWLANRLIQQEGLERAEALAEAYTRRPPLYLRVIGPTPLSGLGVPVDAVPGALKLSGMDDDIRTDVESGRAIIQDLGSQLVGHFCRPTPHARILDGCAGLGGKSLHLADMVTSGSVTAVDPNASKLRLLQSAAERLGSSKRIGTFEGTLQEFSAQADEDFDVVLIDAPCTGLGTMRRHPETRWRRSESDISTLAKMQMELLDAAAELVVPGGTLVYSVCTFTREETSKQAERFEERHPEFSRVGRPDELLDWPTFLVDDALVTTPLEHDCDGFYAARFVRAQSP